MIFVNKYPYVKDICPECRNFLINNDFMEAGIVSDVI